MRVDNFRVYDEGLSGGAAAVRSGDSDQMILVVIPAKYLCPPFRSI
jgi:hypothetical protein